MGFWRPFLSAQKLKPKSSVGLSSLLRSFPLPSLLRVHQPVTRTGFFTLLLLSLSVPVFRVLTLGVKSQIRYSKWNFGNGSFCPNGLIIQRKRTQTAIFIFLIFVHVSSIASCMNRICAVNFRNFCV